MKATGSLLAALLAVGLGGCAADTSTSTTTSTTTPASAPYVVESYPSSATSYCTDCGTVQSVSERQIAGKLNVGGAVIGAIIGGVVGHQFGSGRGQDAATVGGAVAGGAVGSQVNKADTTTVYDLNVRMDNGDYRTITVAATGSLRAGSRVRISGDRVTPL